MDIRFPYSPAEVAKVRTVQFGILSPDEIVNFSNLSSFFICSNSTNIPRLFVWLLRNHGKVKRGEFIRWLVLFCSNLDGVECVRFIVIGIFYILIFQRFLLIDSGC